MSDSSATTTEREALARRFFEDGFNEGLVDALDEVTSDDRGAEAWSNWDTLGQLQQIGASPAPESLVETVSVQVHRAATLVDKKLHPAERRLARPTPGR